MAKVPDGEEKIAENFHRLRRVHERYSQTTDGTVIAYSKCERTYAKNCQFEGDALRDTQPMISMKADERRRNVLGTL